MNVNEVSPLERRQKYELPLWSHLTCSQLVLWIPRDWNLWLILFLVNFKS